MKKRILAIVLMLCLLVGLVACGNNNNTKNDVTGTPAGSGSQADPKKDDGNKDNTDTPDTSVDPSGLPKMADAGDPITYKVFVRDAKTAPSKDNPIIKKIQELTGVTIEFEFLVGDLEQKIGVMIAGEDYPDAMFVGDDAPKFIDAGAYIPIEGYLDSGKYPNLTALYAHPSYVPKMTAADGHKYVLEIYTTRNNPAPIFDNGGAGFFIQKAVLADAGYVIPKTVDEYFNVLEAYKAKYPEIDGVKTAGYEILTDGWRDFCLRNPPQHLMGTGNEGDVYVDPETKIAEYYQVGDAAYGWYKKLNEEYHKGMIDDETFVNSYDQYIAKMSTGVILGMFDQRWNFGPAENVLKTDGKYERTYAPLPIVNEGYKDGYLDPADYTGFTGNNGIGITVNCKNPERLLAFYDWMLKPEVQDYLQWGVLNEDYVIAEDGIGKLYTEEGRKKRQDETRKRDETGDILWNYCPKRQGTYDNGAPCGAGESVDEYFVGMSDYDKEFLGKYGFKCYADFLSEPVTRGPWYPAYTHSPEPGSAAAEAVTTRENLNRKWFPIVITCPADQFDTQWNAYLAEWNAADLQPYLDSVNAYIQSRLAQ